jgi:drug/metabolite transporter (DMT)-like permease
VSSTPEPMPAQLPSPAPPAATSGLLLAMLSAAGFGTSGAFAKSLIESGWSPGAAVTVRIGGAALVLAVPTLVALRGRWGVLRRHARMLVLYGVVAMAACQLFYFQAVSRLPVGVALLLEYLAPVLLVAWTWMRTGRAPAPLTIIGSVVSMFGLVLVLDVTGAVELDLVGVAWALGAAVTVVVYFVLSAREHEGLPPLVMAGAGMAAAAVALLIAGLVGIMPLRADASDVTFLDRQVHWAVPAAGLVVLSTALAYVWGIGAARRLGSQLASFVGLTEVLCAVLFAWLLLDELPVPIQLLGGVLIVVGIGCIRAEGLRTASGLSGPPEPGRAAAPTPGPGPG